MHQLRLARVLRRTGAQSSFPHCRGNAGNFRYQHFLRHMVQSGIYLYRGGFVGGRALRPRWARSGRLRVGVRCRHSLRPQRAGPLAWQAVPCPPPALFRGPAAQPRAVGQARLETPSGVFPGGLQPPATGPPPVHPARPAACMQPAAVSYTHLTLPTIIAV